MSTKETGGPAFPSSYATPGGPQAYDDNHGMTLRDYFAASAMQGCAVIFHRYSFDEIAEKAYRLADVMLEERAKT